MLLSILIAILDYCSECTNNNVTLCIAQCDIQVLASPVSVVIATDQL